MAAAVSSSQRRPSKASSCLPSCFCPAFVDDRDESTPAPPDHALGTEGRKRLPEKLRKVKKRSKIGTKMLAHKSSDRSHNGSSCTTNSYIGAYLIEHVHDPVQNPTRTTHSGSLEPGSGRTNLRFDTPAGLIVVSVMLVMILYYGRLFGIFCFSICCYFISLRQSLLGGNETDRREVDMDSKEYKKKVVLMGLLERKKAWVPLNTVERSN